MNALMIVAGLCWAGVYAHATIGGFTQLKIDFTDPQDAQAKAVWSDTNKLSISTNGLGWDGEVTAAREGWIQTKPIGVGLAWRPTSAVVMQVRVEPPPKPITLNNGQTYTPYFGRVFARYSPDARHWSSWHALRQDWEKQRSVHNGTMGVPRREAERLQARREEYAKMDVPWRDDAEAFVEWLVKREPDFFATSLPFIGYVEFLIEGTFQGGQRVRSFEAEINWSVSGLHHPLKEGGGRLDVETPWRYKAR